MKFFRWSILLKLERCDNGCLRCGVMKVLEFWLWWIRFCLKSILRVLCVVMWEMFRVLLRLCLEGSVFFVFYWLVWIVFLRLCVSCR